MRITGSDKEIDLITELKECDEEYENAILGTYNLNPEFFEEIILPILKTMYIQNIVLIIDKINYDNTFTSAKKAGIYYSIQSIKIKNTFHAKFILLTSDEKGKLILGSANLTLQGYTRNAELVTVIEFDTKLNETLSCFWAVKEFLQKLISNNLIPNKKIIEQIQKTLDVPWLKQPNASSSGISIIHNLEKPILTQIQQEIKANIIHITLFAYLVTPNSIEQLSKMSTNIHLIIQPDKIQGLKGDDLKNLIKMDNFSLKISKIEFGNFPDRLLHAKAIIFKGNRESYCLSGSANATEAGIISKYPDGNIELCVFRFEEDKNHFDYLLKNSLMKLENIDCDKIVFKKISPPEEVKIYQFELYEALIENDKLYLKFQDVDISYRYINLIITRTTDGKTLPIRKTRDNSNPRELEIQIDKENQNFLQKSSYIVMKFYKNEKDQDFITSSRAWIHNIVKEFIPTKKEIEEITKSGGRTGLFQLIENINQGLNNQNLMIYYLNLIDFKDFEDSLTRIRSDITKTVYDEDPEREMLERVSLSMKGILKKLIERNIRKYNNIIKESKEFPPSKFNLEFIQKIFNFFLFINKLIVWCVLKKYTGVINLVKICGYEGTIKKLCMDFFNQLKAKVEEQEAFNFFDKLEIAPHIIILYILVKKNLENNRQFMRENIEPMKEYLKILYNGIQNCSDYNILLNKSESNQEKYERILGEYREFRNLNIDFDEISIQISDLLMKFNDLKKFKKRTF